MVFSHIVLILFVAGLLTEDPRVHERQKPGQAGPRRKYTWYAFHFILTGDFLLLKDWFSTAD